MLTIYCKCGKDITNDASKIIMINPQTEKRIAICSPCYIKPYEERLKQQRFGYKARRTVHEPQIVKEKESA